MSRESALKAWETIRARGDGKALAKKAWATRRKPWLEELGWNDDYVETDEDISFDVAAMEADTRTDEQREFDQVLKMERESVAYFNLVADSMKNVPTISRPERERRAYRKGRTRPRWARWAHGPNNP